MARTVIDELTTIFRFEVDRKGLRQVDRAVGNVNKRVAVLGKGFARIGSGLRQLGGAATVASGIVGKLGLSFEGWLLKYQTMLGFTKSEAVEAGDMLRKMAKETARPVEDLAAAYFELRSAGQSAAEAQESLFGAARGSAALWGSTRALTDMGTSVMETYGNNMEDVLNKFGVAVEKGRIASPEEFGSALSDVLPIAGARNIDLEDIFAVFATGSLGGLSQSKISTGLERMIESLTTPTPESRKLFDEMGYTPQQMRDALANRPLAEVLKPIMANFRGREEDLRKLLGSSEAVKMVTVLDQKMRDFESIAGLIRNDSGGVLNDAYAAALQSNVFTIAQAMAELRDVGLNLYNNVIGPLIRGFANLSDGVQMLVIGLVGLNAVAALGLGTGLGGIVTGIWTLAGAFGVALIPKLLLFGVIIAGIAGAIYGVILLFRHWGDITKWVSEKWNALKEGVAGVWDKLKGFIGTSGAPGMGLSAPLTGPGSAQTSNNTVNVGEMTVEVDASGMSPEEARAVVESGISDSFRNLKENYVTAEALA